MKFFKNSYWLQSGAYAFLQRFLMLLFGFGTFFFLIRAVSKEDFGAWALYLSIATIIEQGKSGLIQNALVKFLASDDQQQDTEIISASLLLNLALSFIVSIVLAVMAPWMAIWLNAPVLEYLLYLHIINTIILVPFSQLTFIQQANFDFKGIFYSNLFRQGVLFFYVLGLFLLSGNYSLTTLVLVQTAGLVLGTWVSYRFARQYFKFTYKLDWAWVSRLFHYGKFVFGTNISSMLLKSTDQLMLGIMTGPVSVAAFNMASRVINFVEVPTTTVAAVVFPQSALRSRQQGNAAVRHLFEKSVGAVYAILLPVLLFVVLFPEFVIMIIAGKEYLDSAFLLQVVIFYCLFIPFSRQFGTIMDSIGKPELNFWLICLLAILNVGFNYFLIGRFDVLGAAYATLLTYVVGFVVYQVILYRLLKVSLLQVFLYMLDFYRQAFAFSVHFLKDKAWISK